MQNNLFLSITTKKIHYVLTCGNTTITVIESLQSRYSDVMIDVKLHQIAEKHNIKNAYQFQKFTGFSPGMASRLWKRNWKNSSLSTLNTLCNLFNCTPNDILVFTPDPEEE